MMERAHLVVEAEVVGAVAGEGLEEMVLWQWIMVMEDGTTGAVDMAEVAGDVVGDVASEAVAEEEAMVVGMTTIKTTVMMKLNTSIKAEVVVVGGVQTKEGVAILGQMDGSMQLMAGHDWIDLYQVNISTKSLCVGCLLLCTSLSFVPDIDQAWFT